MFRSLGQVSGVGLSSAMLQASLNKQLTERFDSPEVSDQFCVKVGETLIPASVRSSTGLDMHRVRLLSYPTNGPASRLELLTR